VYEVGLSKSFTAWHLMPEMEGPEGELHSHEYRAEAIIERDDLDEAGMVCNLDAMEAALEGALERINGRDLEEIRPEGAPAVTVEVLARWLHAEIARRIGNLSGGLAIRVWESPVAFGGYSAPVASSSS
jgi:6-pyruvoyltetrahydropterin/6-carboxytetrahydropterin synthase